MAHDDLLDLKAERDDWQAGARSGKKSDQTVKRNSSGGGGIFAIIVSLVLAVLLAGMGYWVATQFERVNGQFERTNQQLTLLSQRVQVLEGKLDISNDSVASSEAALRATLKEHDSEIRKLWGVSYDRNRKSIKDQAKEIATLKANAKNLSAKTSKLESTVKTVDQQVSEISRLKLGESLASVKAELKKTSEQITALSNQVKPYLPKLENYQVNIDSNTRQIKELNDELIRSVTDLQIQLNDNSLDKEVDKLSKLIASIDKNRTRVNAELVQLSKKVNELQKKMAGTK
jgi:DNA repair exonuclease SbcCD ATPase subunit